MSIRLITKTSLNTYNLLPNIIRNITSKHSDKTKSANESTSAQYCFDLVKKHDYENFLCTLLLKGDQRRFAMAVRAFNVELAKVSTKVSEDKIGKIRLQFWHDSLDKCFDSKHSYVSDHPVLKELQFLLYKTKLNKLYLKRLITARDRPPNQTFKSVQEMEEYAEQSVSSLYYILLEIHGIKDLNVDHAISHLGKAQGITNLLRAIPVQGRDVAVNIPLETLMKNGVSQERILRHQLNDKKVEECVFEIATVANQHLEKARSLSKNVPSNIANIFLPAVAVDRYLSRLRYANFRLSDKKLLRRDQNLPLAFWWYKIRSKY